LEVIFVNKTLNSALIVGFMISYVLNARKAKSHVIYSCLAFGREKGKDPPQVQQQLVPPPTEFHRISTPSTSHCTLIHQGTGRYAAAIPLAASSNIAASTVPQSSFLPEAANWTAPTRGANTAPNGFSDVQLQ
jgi:hypothetical protein